MVEKRGKWKERAAELCAGSFDHLVFLDESGVNINLVTLYGWAPGEERVVDFAPVSKPVSTTVVAGITPRGPIASATWEGGTTKARFIDYARNVLAPALHPGDVVVMDNLTPRHAKEVREAVGAAGAIVEHLPPYSPDMNPIEQMWSKMKGILRKARIRLRDLLVKAVESILAHDISAENCVGWFAGDGYVRPEGAQ